MQLVRIQPQGATGVGLGPPGETALRKSLLAHPKTLPVAGQTLDGVATARAENKECPGKRIARKGLTAQGRQAIDALAIIPSSE